MTPSQMRRYDLDWLRVLLFGTLVPFHALLGFVDEGTILYGYRNQDIAGIGAERMLLLLELWHMPSLFLISGVATFFIMQNQGVIAFLGNRLARIFVPLVIGIVFWNTVIAYYQASIAFSAPSFPLFWWNRLPTVSFYQADHLWFLVNLLCYSILSIPLFQWMQQNRTSIFVKWFPIFALLAILATAILVKPQGMAFNGYITWQTVTYVFYYALGFWLLVAPPTVWGRLHSVRYVLLCVGTLLAILLGALLPSAQITEDGFNLMTGGYWTVLNVPRFNAPHMAFAVVYAIATLAWCAILLGFAYRHLSHPHRWLAPLNRAVYPLYIFHMVFIFVSLFYLRFVSWPWFPEFLILTLGTYALSACLYLLFDSIKPLRLLVGLSQPKRPK